MNVNYTQMEAIPEAIGELSNLEILYLHGNAFTSVPDSILRLKKLRRLSLGLGALPKSRGR